MDTTSDKKSGIKKKIIIVFLVIVVAAVIALAAVYVYFENYYGSHFMKGTIVNGIEVSKLSKEELNEKIKDYTLVITEKTADGSQTEETIQGSQIGLTAGNSQELDTVLKNQKGGKWLFGKGKEYQIDNLTEYDASLWEQQTDALQCFADDFVEEPQNAYVKEYDEETGTFELVPEVAGNQLDKDKTQTVLTDAVAKLADSVDLSESQCYLSPEITSDNQELKDFYEKLNQYASTNITYTFGENVEELTGADICGWLVIDYDNRQVSLDADRVSEYVSYLKWNYDTIFGTRQFATSYGQTVTIEGGDYGWWMNKDEEVAGLTAMIEAGESGERKPVYYQEAVQYGELDYGNTYVEINLTSQHLFVYVDGELKLESDFCSGKPSTGHATPAGTYAVTYTEKYATLKGDNYNTPVTYWMPFNEDIGLHDATWKTEFGSNYYQSAGSHGCINLPYNVAKEVFQYVEKGMPVICYFLPGTESTSVTLQSDQEKAQASIDAINEIATSSNPARQTQNARATYNEISSDSIRALVTNYSDLLAYEAMYN